MLEVDSSNWAMSWISILLFARNAGANIDISNGGGMVLADTKRRSDG